MAYPTVNFQLSSPTIGAQQISVTSGTQAHDLGAIVKGRDATYGEGEFVYLKGVASTAAGDVVCYDSKAATTVRAVAGGATSTGPVAVAMSANVASQYGWYCVSGSVPANAATASADTQAHLSASAGQIDDATGTPITGMLIKAATSGGFATVQLNRPSVSPESAGSNSGDVSLAAVGSTPSDNGASLSGQALTLQPADATHPGLITSGTQTIGGAKTFNTAITSSVASGSNAFIAASGARVKIGTPYFVDDGGGTLRSSGGFASNASVQMAPGNAFGVYGTGFARLLGSTANGASAVGNVIDTENTFSTAGAKLVSVRNNTTEKAYFTKDGSLGGTYTDTSGSPGAATANTVTGRSAIANGASSVVITNSLVATSSIISVQLESSGIGVGEIVVTPGSGSFTVTSVNALGVATNVTGAATFSWIVINGA